MSLHKIAITIPPDVLTRLDRWAAHKKQSRSRFIAEQLEKRLQELEDEEVTRLYNEAYRDATSLQENQRFVEEIEQLTPKDDRDEGW